MGIEVSLIGESDGAPRSARVSPNGELITASLEYSTTTFQDMDTVDTAFNFVKPTANKRFVLTAVLLFTNKDIGVNGAIIIFYEASAADSIVVDKTLVRVALLKNDRLILPAANFIATEGKFINGKTDDASVFVTIAGYEVDAF